MTSSNRKPSPKKPSQLDKFKEAARDLECDDDEQHFKDKLGKLVKRSSSDSADDRK